MPMDKTKNEIVGFTDTGQPIVLPEHACPNFRAGRDRLLESRICWYCQWADFRKTTDTALMKSICRCPNNRVTVVHGSENEHLDNGGTTK